MLNKKLKIIFFLLGFLFLAAPISADGVVFSVTPVYGQIQGMLKEYVFHDNDKDGSYEYVLSRLDWEISPRSFYGAKLSLGTTTDLNHQFIFSTTLQQALTGESGFIEDRDWQWELSDGYYDGKLTDYSRHNNNVVDNCYVSLQGDWILPHGFGISIGWDFWKISFQGKGGYSQHGVAHKKPQDWEYWTPDMDKSLYPDTSIVLTYTFETNYLKTGITYSTPNTFPLRLKLGLWGNLIDSANGLDGHYSLGQPYNWFQDVMYTFFPGYLAEATLLFQMSRRTQIQISAETSYVKAMKGNTYQRTEPSKSQSKAGIGGAEYQTWNCAIGFTYTF